MSRTVKFISCLDEDFKTVKEIRNTVFQAEQGIDETLEYDFYDTSEDTVFALTFESGKAVACGRIAFIGDSVKIGRIAVLKNSRNSGSGAFIVKSMCRKCAELGYDSVLVDSQLQAEGFYRKLGFVRKSDDVFVDRGIKHIHMIKRISHE